MRFVISGVPGGPTDVEISRTRHLSVSQVGRRNVGSVDGRHRTRTTCAREVDRLRWRAVDSTPAGEPESGSKRLAVLLAMAMFVLVVDTSLMNVSISAVVKDLGTTVSGVQSAIALEALVSAAFILIGSKV